MPRVMPPAYRRGINRPQDVTACAVYRGACGVIDYDIYNRDMYDSKQQQPKNKTARKIFADTCECLFNHFFINLSLYRKIIIFAGKITACNNIVKFLLTCGNRLDIVAKLRHGTAHFHCARHNLQRSGASEEAMPLRPLEREFISHEAAGA